MTEHLSRLALERLAADEAPAAAVAHVADCAACRAQVAELRAAHAQVRAALDVPACVAAILRTARPPRRWPIAAALVAAAAIALIVIVRRPDVRLDGRTKGGDGLVVIVRSADGQVTELVDGEPLVPGDAIRFRATAATAGFAGVIGLDAAGAVTPYAPDGDHLQPIAAHAPLVFDGSIILDDTLGPERLVLVLCDDAHAIADLVASARAALARASGDPRKLGAISACREVALTIEKVRP